MPAAALSAVLVGASLAATVALVVDLARGWRQRSIRERARAFADNELDDILDKWLNAPGADAHSPTGT